MNMITPDEIKIKAERKYAAYLQTIAEGVSFSEIVINCNVKTWQNLAEYQLEIRNLTAHSKEKKGYGYSVKYKTVNTRNIGTQDIPVEISFKTEIDFLRYLHKEKEVGEYRADCSLILSKFPELKEWIIKNPTKVIKYHDKWENILKICSFFKDKPTPNKYIRELPIQVNTKFIENNEGIIKELLDILIKEHIQQNEKEFEKRFNLKYAEPLVRFRILDESISQQYFSGIDDVSIPISQFEKLELSVKKVFVVENKMNFLTFPIINEAIVIFGSGYSIENLKNTKWLKDVKLYYCGDLDIQGFEILSQFRGYFSHARSILMDNATFKQFEKEKGAGIESNIPVPQNLTDEERELYDLLKKNNYRLEQEKIPMEYVKQTLDELFQSI